MEKLIVKKTIAVLISGRAGVGKTTVANMLSKYLKERYDANVATFPMANRLKFIARMLGWDDQKDEKGRALLQDLGRIARDYDKDVWVRGTILGTIESHPNYPFDVILVDDWRFPNEETFIRKNILYFPILVRIEAPQLELLKGTPQYLDVSETSLDLSTYKYDDVIFNLGTIEELSEQVLHLWDIILEHAKENIEWT